MMMKKNERKNMWKNMMKLDRIIKKNLIFGKSFSLKVFLRFFLFSPDILLYTGL